MAYEEMVQSITIPSGIDWTDKTNQYRGVAFSVSGRAILPSAPARMIGVMQINPGIDEAGTVAIRGITKAYAGAAIALGHAVTVGADGSFTDTGAPPSGAANEVGIAMTEAAAAGDIFSLLLMTKA